MRRPAAGAIGLLRVIGNGAEAVQRAHRLPERKIAVGPDVRPAEGVLKVRAKSGGLR